LGDVALGFGFMVMGIPILERATKCSDCVLLVQAEGHGKELSDSVSQADKSFAKVTFVRWRNW